MEEETKTGEKAPNLDSQHEIAASEESHVAQRSHKKAKMEATAKDGPGPDKAKNAKLNKRLLSAVAGLVLPSLSVILAAVAVLTNWCEGPPLPPQISEFSVKDTEEGRRIFTRDRFLHRLAITNPSTNPISPIGIEVNIHMLVGTAQASPASQKGGCNYRAQGTRLTLECATLAVNETEIVFSTAPAPLKGRFELFAGGAKTVAGKFDCALLAMTADFQPCELTLPNTSVSPCSVINRIRYFLS